ncbi:hypothetical protein Q7P35_004434 [Cladosporium inversicolor]
MGKHEFERSYWSTSTLAEQNSYSRGRRGNPVSNTSTTTTNEKDVSAAGRSVKKARLDFNSILEIRVGDEGCFLVPVNRITERSKVLRDHYLQQSADGDEIPIIDLPKEDRFVFDIYLQVVYQNEVFLPLHVDEAKDPHWSIRAMIRTYMLAERLEDTTSCNILVDGLIEFCSRHDLVFEADDWKLIFHGDYKGPVPRKLAVDFCVIATHPGFLKAQMGQMPLGMAIDCVGRFADLRHEMIKKVDRDETPYAITALLDLDICERYHQHSESCPPCSTSARESKRKASIHRRDTSASSQECSELDSYYSAQQQQWE